MDQETKRVFDWLSRDKRAAAGMIAARRAVDFALDGPRTRRYSIDQLSKNEKTNIGTMFEIFFIEELGIEKDDDTNKLDVTIDGVIADIKFTISDNWMIPKEAVGEVCILGAVDEPKSTFSLGVIRADEEVLTSGSNQDKKRTISAAGKRKIAWLRCPPLTKNQLLHLPTKTREYVLEAKSGQKAINRLCESLTREPIRRYTIETVASQLDPAKRVREARKQLSGYRILSGRYDSAEARKLGFDLEADEWVVIPPED